MYFLDESGFDTYFTRLWGYATGQLNLKISGLKFKRVIACSNQGKLVCPMTYNGTATCETVEDYFETYLLSNIPPNSTIVLDNARVHNKLRLQVLCDKYQIELYFLPPYCPDLNKIEQVWANIKRYLQNYYNHLLSFLILKPIPINTCIT